MSGPGQSFQSVDVSLSASSVWPITITPSLMTFLPEEMGTSRPFEVCVRVPNYTSATQNGEYIIGGSMTPQHSTVSYPIPETKGIITIAPYTLLQLSSLNPCQDVHAGDIVACDLIVNNHGNIQVYASLEVGDYEEWTDNGWNFSFPHNDVFIYEGMRESIDFLVVVPGGARLQSYTILIIARSKIGNESDEKEFQFILNVTSSSKTDGNDDKGDDTLDDAGQEELGREAIPAFHPSMLLATPIIWAILCRKRPVQVAGGIPARVPFITEYLFSSGEKGERYWRHSLQEYSCVRFAPMH